MRTNEAVLQRRNRNRNRPTPRAVTDCAYHNGGDLARAVAVHPHPDSVVDTHTRRHTAVDDDSAAGVRGHISSTHCRRAGRAHPRREGRTRDGLRGSSVLSPLKGFPTHNYNNNNNYNYISLPLSLPLSLSPSLSRPPQHSGVGWRRRTFSAGEAAASPNQLSQRAAGVFFPTEGNSSMARNLWPPVGMQGTPGTRAIRNNTGALVVASPTPPMAGMLGRTRNACVCECEGLT